MYDYMALGDSITVGVGASSRYCAYPWLIKSRLTEQLSPSVRLSIIARSGWSSTALMTSLFNQDPDRIRRTNVVIIWVGGVDMLNAGRAILRGKDANLLNLHLTRYKQNLTTMIRGIKQISRAKIILCTQFNPFPNSPIAVNGIHSLNQITKEAAACFCTGLAPIHTAYSGSEYLLIQGYKSGSIEDVFNESSPPIHPNDEGQRVAADVIYTRF
jgi:acyl-CoA thioesterase-1